MKDYDQFERDLIYNKDEDDTFIYKNTKHVSTFRKPRIIHLTSNHLKNLLRDRIQLMFVIGFPIIFIFLFSLQADSISSVTYDIYIINNDIAGFEDDPDEFKYPYNISASFALIELFKDEQFQNIFSIKVINDIPYEEAIQRLENEEYHGLLVIEPNFSEKIFYMDTFILGNPEVQIITIKDELVLKLLTETTHQLVNVISININGGEPPELILQDDSYFGRLTYFDLFLPAILIASILMCISQVATHFAAEKESGTLRRLSTTSVSRYQILISGALAQFIITTFQITLMITLGMILGAFIHPNANWFLLYLILILVTSSALGLGLLLASFLKSYNQAGIFVWFVILPLQFLGGLFTYGNEFEYSHIFPTYWALHALRLVMLYDITAWEIIGYDLTYLAIFTIVVITIGILLFHRKTAILT
ncbi:MAG: ABC transporter permease [Asgard group archaeon]|nr:ABC transporter permease [Asgard group archaeon]